MSLIITLLGGLYVGFVFTYIVWTEGGDKKFGFRTGRPAAAGRG